MTTVPDLELSVRLGTLDDATAEAVQECTVEAACGAIRTAARRAISPAACTGLPPAFPRTPRSRATA